jgi:threonyl-tRNA synthetase
VRQFTQDDAHIYCRPDQVQAEIADLLALVREWYGLFGLPPSFRLATRPPDKLGTEEQWDSAEEALHLVLGVNQLAYDLDKGGAAFYGPKIDIDVEDALGRKWQLATIQVDLTMLPERMECEYIDADGQPKRPVVIHRAIFGSYDRFIAILTEHFAGAFPIWLAPVQTRVLPISEKHAEYGRKVYRELRAARIRAELDDRNEKLGYRIRDAQVRKVPYTLVVGEREAQQGTVSLRRRGSEESVVIPVDRLAAELSAEISSRSALLTVGRSA